MLSNPHLQKTAVCQYADIFFIPLTVNIDFPVRKSHLLGMIQCLFIFTTFNNGNMFLLLCTSKLRCEQ